MLQCTRNRLFYCPRSPSYRSLCHLSDRYVAKSSGFGCVCSLVRIGFMLQSLRFFDILKMSSPFLMLDIGNRANRLEEVPSPKEKAGMRHCFARLGWKGYWQLSMLGPSAVKPS